MAPWRCRLVTVKYQCVPPTKQHKYLMFTSHGLNPIKVSFCPEEKRFAGRGWRGHEAICQSVRREDFECAARFQDGSRAVLAKEIEPSVRVNWRGSVLATNSFGPDDLSGGGVDARHETFFRRGVKQALNEQRRGIFADVGLQLPNHIRVGDVAVSFGLDGPQLGLRQTSNKESQMAIEH